VAFFCVEFGVYIQERQAGCQAAIASRLAPTGEWCTSATNWSAVRPPSRASHAPTGEWCTSATNWSAVRSPSRAGSLPQGNGVHLRVIGRLSGRHREQARSHNGSVFAFRPSPLNRPSVSSPAALDLDPPAPIGRLSGGVHLGGRRAAPFDEVEHIERRLKRSQPEAMPPDECRSEGTPSLSEGLDAWGETFASFGLGRHSGVCQRESP
jgi:hypothetical protein